ncbi:MAG: aminotransferase class V-fold PLP-dependent enzyme [Alphaproteobacteria bacterium]|nr:aminotransferase class V-fold PLP-dependent enzyme [Alphaproteobacteria bacterium]
MPAVIDLDHNAGSPLRPEARAAMLAALDAGGNASAVHGRGRAAKARLEDARDALAAACGVGADRVVFTAGGTEADALALHGRRVAASAVEHPAVLAQPGVVATVPVDAAGRVRVDAVAGTVTASGADTVAVMAANNETGVIQPLADVRAALPVGVRLHVDAVQAPGRLDLAGIVAGADTVALSAHKLGGPAGVGAVALGPGIEPLALVRGGGHERGRRGGTENLPGVAGFAAALGATVAAAEDAGLGALRDRLEAGLRDLVPELVVFGAAAPRLANTLAVSAPGWRAETLVMAFDLAGVAVSSGAACSSGRVRTSHVLEAMGARDELIDGMIRFSLGWTSEVGDIERALAAMAPILRRRRAA